MMGWKNVREPNVKIEPPQRPADPINPGHYQGGFRYRECECIDLARELPFSIGNAVKYIWRAGRKGDAREDLKKALWYIEDARTNLRLTQEQKTRAGMVADMMRLMPETPQHKQLAIKSLVRGQYHEAMLEVQSLACVMGVILDD